MDVTYKQHQSSPNEFVKKHLSRKLSDPFDKRIVHQPKCKLAALSTIVSTKRTSIWKRCKGIKINNEYNLSIIDNQYHHYYYLIINHSKFHPKSMKFKQNDNKCNERNTNNAGNNSHLHITRLSPSIISVIVVLFPSTW